MVEGKSTFMVEMEETANIVNNGTACAYVCACVCARVCLCASLHLHACVWLAA